MIDKLERDKLLEKLVEIQEFLTLEKVTFKSNKYPVYLVNEDWLNRFMKEELKKWLGQYIGKSLNEIIKELKG